MGQRFTTETQRSQRRKLPASLFVSTLCSLCLCGYFSFINASADILFHQVSFYDGAMTIHGRGAAENPPNRFETLRYETNPVDSSPSYEAWEGDDPTPAPATQFLKDTS